MAAPNKTGLGYFSLDVDFSSDPKIKFLKARHKALGAYIYLEILQTIYRNGYYAEWDEVSSEIFADSNGLTKDELGILLEDMFKCGLLSRQLYDKYKILTSRGIQKRYLMGVKRRRQVKMFFEYLLLDLDEFRMQEKNFKVAVDIVYINPPQEELMLHLPSTNGVNVNNNPVNVDINSQTETRNKKQETRNRNTPAPETLFEQFWTAYPNRRNRDKAEAQWNNLRVDQSEGLFGLIMDGLKKYKKTRQWEDPRFIPFAHNWLRDRRWKDDMEAVERDTPGKKGEEAEAGVLDCFKIDLEDFRD